MLGQGFRDTQDGIFRKIGWRTDACVRFSYLVKRDSGQTFNSIARILWTPAGAGGGLAIIGALGFNFCGNYLVDKTIRVYNEKATLRARVPRAEAGLGLDMALKF